WRSTTRRRRDECPLRRRGARGPSHLSWRHPDRRGRVRALRRLVLTSRQMTHRPEGAPRHMARIIYTHTDEAPMLATASFLPILDAFSDTAGIEVTTRDISLAGRIVAAFSDLLPEEQREADALAELGELAKTPE